MICDGYTEHCELSGFHFVYRPLLAHQRAAMKAEWSGWPDWLVERAVRGVLDRQILLRDWLEHGAIPKSVLMDVWRVVTGTGNDEREQRDAANLAKAARLYLEHPYLARTSCRQCRHFAYNPLEQRVVRDHAGKPLLRAPGGLVLCETPVPCPKGHHSSPLAFSAKNRQAFRHWLACGRSGCPDDEIVRRNWSIIADVQDRLNHDRSQRHRRHPATHGRSMGRGAGRTAHDVRHVPG